MDLYRILKQAYNFGRDNGSGKSEKNLNDFIEIPKIKQLLIPVVVGQSEQLFCYHKGSYTLNKDGTCCKCHRPPEPKAK